MSHSLSGHLFSGPGAFGIWPFDGGDDPGIVDTDGSGGTPIDPQKFCRDSGGTVGADGKCYYGTTASGGGCPTGQYKNILTGKCEANPEYVPGGTPLGYKPCPDGQAMYNGKCVKVGSCPSGQTWGLDTQKCESQYTYKAPGTTVPKAPPKPVTPAGPPPPDGFLPDWLTPGAIGIGLLVAAGVGAVYYRRKKRGGLAMAYRRAYAGLGALAPCPGGYTYNGAECVPNDWDCRTPSGDYGKSDGAGGCTYILKPIPNVPATTGGTSTPVTTLPQPPGPGPVTTQPPAPPPVGPSLAGKPCSTVLGQGITDASGACVLPSNMLPCKGPSGEDGILLNDGRCLYVPKPVAPKPLIPPTLLQGSLLGLSAAALVLIGTKLLLEDLSDALARWRPPREPRTRHRHRRALRQLHRHRELGELPALLGLGRHPCARRRHEAVRAARWLVRLRRQGLRRLRGAGHDHRGQAQAHGRHIDPEAPHPGCPAAPEPLPHRTGRRRRAAGRARRPGLVPPLAQRTLTP